MRRVALYAVLAAVVVAAAIASGATGATSASPCTSRGLVVWLDTQGNGAAGSVFYELRFTNLSGRACTLRGYPGVSAIGVAGRQLGSPARRNPAHAVRIVRLRNGGSATAILQITETGNYPRTLCRATTAAGLRVYPPNQTAAKVVPFPFGACTRTGTTYLSVQPVQPAAR